MATPVQSIIAYAWDMVKREEIVHTYRWENCIGDTMCHAGPRLLGGELRRASISARIRWIPAFAGLTDGAT